MTCPKTEFTEETSVTIQTPEEDHCCGDEIVETVVPSLVQYNGLYCHPGSANFSATPIGDKRCFDPDTGEETPPDPPPPPPIDPPVISDPPAPVPEEPDAPDPEDPEPTPTISAPTVNNREVNNITPTTARLRAFVNPNGFATNVHFEWGLTTALGNVTGTQAIGNGVADVSVIADIVGLTPDTIYHYKAFATNAGGTTTSIDRVFTTTDLPVVEPPPPATGFRFMRGMFSNYTRIGQSPFPDLAGTVQGNSFATTLQTCDASNARAIIACLGGSGAKQIQAGDPELDSSSEFYDASAIIGGFSMRRTKINADRAHSVLPDANALVDSGAFAGANIFDDFRPDSAVWNGDPPTSDEVDEVARYLKAPPKWSRVPCYVRGHFDFLTSKTNWQYLDGAWLQWVYRYGDPAPWFAQQLRLAQKLKLGFILGFNILNGGGGPNASYTDGSVHGWNVRPGASHLYGMSPTELVYVSQAAKLYASYSVGYFGWTLRNQTTGSTEYFDRADIQTALTTSNALFVGLTAGPINGR